MAEVLVVVAAGPGLGRAVALRFAREGFAVGLVARSPDRLSGLAAEVTAAGSPSVAVAGADVGEEDALRAALRQVAGELGPATVLVFNGSAYVEGSGLSISAADLRSALDVGVVGAMVAAQEVAAAMRAVGRGTVILTGSVAADRASTSATAVGVAKAGLRNFGLSLHKELAPEGVRVTTVTINGVLSGAKALDVAAIADRYWQLHSASEPPEAVTTFPMADPEGNLICLVAD
ncbi:MAG: SDR family NAD(P)-dependent oxidoreductase [Spirochaetaceae bacterium]|nr:SDR family NAD(P)-dependent oxidoreductase [Spirochaetaceae bacterium]